MCSQEVLTYFAKVVVVAAYIMFIETYICGLCVSFLCYCRQRFRLAEIFLPKFLLRLFVRTFAVAYVETSIILYFFHMFQP